MHDRLGFSQFRNPERQELNDASMYVVDTHAPIRPAKSIRWVLTAMVFGLIFTERFGIPIGLFTLGTSLPLMYLLLVVLALRRELIVDVTSAVIFCGIALIAIASYLVNSNVVDGKSISINSLFLLLVIYFPLVFRMSGSVDTYAHWLWTMRMVVTLLLVLAVAGILQFFLQFVFHPSWLFDISQLIPESIRGQGVFNSAIPTASKFKANGFFSREPSGFSFYMALGLLIELGLFRRMMWMLLFGLALVLSYSGTGILILAIGILLPFRAKVLARLGLFLLVVLGTNALLGDPMNLAFTLDRVGEFSASGSSAYARYVAPMQLVDAQIDTKPWSVLLGSGPGTIQKVAALYDSHDPTWAKLLFEYGTGGFVLFVIFVGYKLSVFTAPFQFCAVLFVGWLVTGGQLLSPENVCFWFVFLAIWPKPFQPQSVPVPIAER